jgi:single-strand DNA-binding protein
MINKVILIGNLGKDPEVKYTQTGTAICSFSLATTRRWQTKDGEKKEETEWVYIEAWSKLAELCGEYLAKGRQAYVEGRLKTDKWTDKQSGQEKYRTKVVAEQVKFLGGKSDRVPAAADEKEPETGSAAPAAPAPDDIPF